MSRAPVFAVLFAGVLPACAETEGPEYHDPDVAFAVAVQQHLAPSTVKVKLFEPMAPSNSGDGIMQFVPVAAGVSDSGALLVHVALDGQLQQAYEALFSIGETGEVQRLDRPSGAPAFDGSVQNLGLPGGVVVHCGAAPTTFRLGASGAEVALEIPGACPGTSVYGPSSAPGYLAGATRAGGTLDFFAHRLDDGNVARKVSVAAPGGQLAFVEESPEGSYLAILRDGNNHILVRSDGSTRSATIPDLFVKTSSALRTPDGIVQFLETGQAVVWDVDAASSTPAVVAAPEVPAEVPSDMWWPGGNTGNAVAVSAPLNPKYDKAHVPIAAQTRRWSAGAFVLGEVPTTPCTSRSDCRKYGESYLLAELDVSTHRVGLYAFWSWTSQLAFFVSPLERKEQP